MTELLSKLNLPTDLQKLNAKELDNLAREVRELIIDVVSKNGGHLASSLGVVELSVALHAVLNSPKDKIIWDVGHQAYAHKILTNRSKKFATLRQFGGISGFPNKDESPHDVFTTGHASTSISTALGLAAARDLSGNDYKIAAVIGDGSLSGGLALEGLNNILHHKSNLILIFNDNEMSISKNVGALANYFTKLRASSLYTGFRDRIEGIISRIPKIGTPLVERAENLKNRVKHFIVDFKMGVIVEELGMKYLGPIDGHNIPLLMSVLHYAKDVKGPVFIHILTKKGKGYKPAEDAPTKFHGISPFDKISGEVKSKGGAPTYTAVFGRTLTELAEKNEKVVAVTAAMPDGTGLMEFAEKYPKRFFDVGIAEGHAVAFSAGLAKAGYRPVVAVYSTFLQRAYDQIIHDVCLQNLPVVFAVDRAGIVGEDGATHNGVFDIAFLRSLPNMTVLAPKDENEFQHMLNTAVKHDGPIAIRYPRGSGAGAKMDSHLKDLSIGKGELVLDNGGETVIFATGSMVYPAIEAVKSGQKKAKVISLSSIKPIDRDLIVEQAKNAKFVVTVEEGVLAGGFGSAVEEVLADESINVPIKRIGLPDKFIEHGTREEILEKYGLTSEKISSLL
ncbi:1-deoxy-D-xylulose-5-phosphate synthase [Candidatus Margulisiibacteriota bacterium]